MANVRTEWLRSHGVQGSCWFGMWLFTYFPAGRAELLVTLFLPDRLSLWLVRRRGTHCWTISRLQWVTWRCADRWAIISCHFCLRSALTSLQDAGPLNRFISDQIHVPCRLMITTRLIMWYGILGVSATSGRQCEFLPQLDWLQKWIWKSQWRILARWMSLHIIAIYHLTARSYMFAGYMRKSIDRLREKRCNFFLHFDTYYLVTIFVFS